MRELFGTIALILAFACYAPYIYDTVRGTTRPHLYTYLIWTVVAVIAFFGQDAAGAGPGAWTTGAMGLLAFVVFILSFRYGTDDITKPDAAFLVLALAAVVPWVITKNPALSVGLATLIDVCAFIPTIRKTINSPSSENLPSWALNALRNALALAALQTLTFTTVVYPAALFIMSAGVVGIILMRRNSVSPPGAKI